MNKRITTYLQNLLKAIIVLVCSISLYVIPTIQAQAQDNTISGTLSLPAGDVAPVGGLSIDVNVGDSPDFVSFFGVNVLIAEGLSSAPYSITVPEDFTVDWQVDYYCSSGCPGYAMGGFFSFFGTQFDSNLTDLLPGGSDHANIDLELLTGNEISGVVSLPAGDVAPVGGLLVDVNIQDVTFYSTFVGTQVLINAGTNSATYSVIVPSDFVDWQVEYYCSSSCPGYAMGGFYSSSGTQFDSNLTDLLPGGSDHANIDLELLTGNEISGVVSLPAGDVAPVGGLLVDVNIQDVTFYSTFVGTQVLINAGTNSATYSVIVPSDFVDWQVEYYCGGCGDYIENGYYNSTGTQSNSNSAEQLTGGSDHTNIDLELLASNTISGTISLPNGELAPIGGFFVDVNISDSPNFSNYYGTSVFIDEGQNSAPYSVKIASDNSLQWQVDYYCGGCGDYLENGYYNSAGTEFDFINAELLAGGVDHTNIDLEFLTGNMISGTVSLPNGELAPMGGINLFVSIGDYPEFNYYQSANVIIPEGQNSANYSVSLPPDASVSWQVNYTCYCFPYLDFGYYNSAGTIGDFSSAELLVGGIDHSGINLELLRGDVISGVVSMPGSDVAPLGGLYLGIKISYDSGSNTSFGFFIQEGMSSVGYSVVLPSDASQLRMVSYDCSNCSDYVSNGYYSSTGTQYDSSSADQLSGGTDQVNIDMELLTGNSIGGTLSLPGSDMAPAGGLSFEIFAEEEFLNSDVARVSVYMPEGQDTVSYSFTVPPDATQNWLVGYSCYNCEPYWRTGYYGNTIDQGLADTLAGGIDHVNINLEAILANVISGELSLPNGDAAPPGGVGLSIFARGAFSYFSNGLNINEGQNSVAYSLLLPPDSSEIWEVGYDCYSNCDGYVNPGFYNSTGTVYDESAAEQLLGGSDYTNIDLELISGIAISGALSLPGSDVAAQDLYFQIQAFDEFEMLTFFDSVKISQNDNSVQYSVTVPDDSSVNWSVQYGLNFFSEAPYWKTGFYNTTQTTPVRSAATQLAGGVSHVNKDMTVLTHNTTDGTVSLPNADTAPAGGVSIYICGETQFSTGPVTGFGYGGISDIFDESLECKLVTIPEGDSSVPYSLKTTPDTTVDWSVSYTCWNCPSVYEDQAYYSTTGTVIGLNNATMLTGGSDHSSIDLTLLVGSAFVDVPVDHPDFIYIEALVDNGIAQGCNLDEFCPDQPMSRDGAAIWLLQAAEIFGYSPPPFAGIEYDDVTGSVFAADWINDLKQHGFTEGCTDAGDLYCPNQSMTKGSAAKMLLMAKGYTAVPAKTGDYADVPNTHPLAGWIDEMDTQGYAQGCETNNYCPGEILTKAGFAKLLAKTFGFVGP